MINDTLVADFLDSVKLRGRSPRTVQTYRESLRKYLGYLGDTDLRTATPRTVRGFLATEQDKGTAPTSLVRHHSAVRVLYRWLVAEDEVTTSPVDRVQAPSAPELPVPTVDTGDLRKLLSVKGRGKFSDHRNRFALLLLLDTGVRAGELLSIGVDDINTNARTVLVRGKTGFRTVGFGARTAIELRRYLRARETHRLANRPELFLGTRGPWSYANLWEMLDRYSERAGVEHVRAHRLRHTWATQQMASDNASEQAVRVAGGWTTTRCMQRYVREATERRAAELNRRNSLVDGL